VDPAEVIDALVQVGPRPAFDAQESGVAASELIAGSLQGLGIEVEYESFPLLAHAPRVPSLQIDRVHYEAGPCMYSQATTSGGVAGVVEYVGVDPFLPGLFEPLRFSILDDSGDEVGRIYGNPIAGGGAGAFAASPGPILTPPAAYLGSDDALCLRDRIVGGGDVRASLVTGGSLERVLQRNVVGSLKGSHARTVVVSAHYDSAVGSPGAIDNASGVAGVIALAQDLVGSGSARVKLVFALFAAEEVGLSGARAYVDRRRANGGLAEIAAVVNLDCIGACGPLSVMTTDYLKPIVEAAAAQRPVALLPPGPGADHFPFAAEGVPALTLLSFPYPEYHLPSDRGHLFDRERFDVATELARAIIHEVIAGES
jgi:aminopeptidase YwaD